MKHKITTMATRASLIEYWVQYPGTTIKELGERFGVNFHTVSDIISRDYLGRQPKNPITITKQSKINSPEYSLLSID